MFICYFLLCFQYSERSSAWSGCCVVHGGGLIGGRGLLGECGGSHLLVSRYSVWEKGSCSKNSKAAKRIQLISVSQSVSCDQDLLLPSSIQTKCRHQLEEKTEQGSTYAFLGRIDGSVTYGEHLHW